ncbi:MAG TPA: hypothetical protein VH418_18505 [Solirubrobacteraceae bacterium]|jgi:hypothetical protein
MRRAHIALLSFIALLALPVAATAKDEPKAVKADAVGVTAAGVTLTAKLVPTVAGTLVAFEYGTTTDYGRRVAASPAVLPLSGATASAHVDGLQPATTYHFRAVLTVAGVDLPGADQTFKTKDAPKDDGEPPKAAHEEAPPKPVHAPTAPVLGRTLAAGPRAGTVRVRKPHGAFVTLTAGADVPAGAVVDATHGTVALTTALGGGETQTAEFSGGRFRVRQSRHAHGMVDLYLRGDIGACAKVASIARKHRRRGRALWGRDHGGKYRTHGANSVATVRGTRWLTRDTCAGTLTRVTRGVVSVRDLRRKVTVTVRAGHAYLARAKR